jgi:pyruvate dehydrogenase E2 component (dihydrolipoamide acetyltransferase)
MNTNNLILKEVHIPDIGDVSDVNIIEINVNVGDTIEKDDTILLLEASKASIEIPSPYDGVVSEIFVKEGDKVSKNSLVLTLNIKDENNKTESENELIISKSDDPIENIVKKEENIVKKEENINKKFDNDNQSLKATSPLVRRMIRELNINIDEINATGPNSRILKEDINNFIKNKINNSNITESTNKPFIFPEIDFSKFGKTQSSQLSRIKQMSGKFLSRNWTNIPHITFFDDADISELDKYRKEINIKKNIKLTYLPFIIKAAAKALQDFPNMNSSLSSNNSELIIKEYINIGIAIDTPNGLLVPVVKDVDKKGLYAISEEISILMKKSLGNKLSNKDMEGGCFTISSIGNIGTTGFAPIVNWPEVGILGVSKCVIKPIYNGIDSFIPKLMLPLSLSADHRVIDGAEAGKFIVSVSKYLNDIRELLL